MMRTTLATCTETLLKADALYKSFTLHTQGGVRLSVLEGISFEIKVGECVALTGASGSGKSTFMRCLYGNYRVDSGAIWVKHEGEWVDLTRTESHQLLNIRQRTIGYVSQFLRVIPRVAALDVAAEPLLELGIELAEAREKAAQMFARLNLPERLWSVSPTTFSGGEKQRVNIARALLVNYPIFLLDEPTSALDATNRQVVIDLLQERKAAGCAMIGIFHDDEVLTQVCDRQLIFGNSH
ncbi:MAG TPA: phosphonate C-P lyase system protein PhnL [Coleofasciculaceae cyanobacterium]|jgi:alpha-D-ribose 1-methylphosphonate 5-triphosphate synthase subunit PhnL